MPYMAMTFMSKTFMAMTFMVMTFLAMTFMTMTSLPRPPSDLIDLVIGQSDESVPPDGAALCSRVGPSGLCQSAPQTSWQTTGWCTKYFDQVV